MSRIVDIARHLTVQVWWWYWAELRLNIFSNLLFDKAFPNTTNGTFEKLLLLTSEISNP